MTDAPDQAPSPRTATSDDVTDNPPHAHNSRFRFSFGSVVDFVFAPVETERLLVFQRLFCVCFFIYMFGWFQHAREWLTSYGFHIDDSTLNAAYPKPFPLLPEVLLVPFTILVFTTTLLGVLNYFPRVVLPVLFVLAVYLQLVDQVASFTLNKLFIFGFFLLTIAPSGQRFGRSSSTWQSAWPIRFLQATLMIQYATAGVCKMVNGDWLKRADVLFTHSVGVYRTEIASLFIQYLPMSGWIVLAYFSLAFETFAPAVFMPKRTRTLAMLLGVGFHLGIAAMMKDLIYFSLQMICFYVVFFPARWSTAIESRIAGWLPFVPSPTRQRPQRSPDDV